MAQRVERQPLPLLGGRIAERERDPAVRDFVEHDRDHEGEDQRERREQGSFIACVDRKPRAPQR